MRRLERLTYVHDGDPGAVGTMINDAFGILCFAPDGSGLLDLAARARRPSPQPPDPREVVVRIVAMVNSQLPPPGQLVVQNDVPCVLGHSGDEVHVLVSSRGLARVTGGVPDLRGKIKFGLARVGWSV